MGASIISLVELVYFCILLIKIVTQKLILNFKNETTVTSFNNNEQMLRSIGLYKIIQNHWTTDYYILLWKAHKGHHIFKHILRHLHQMKQKKIKCMSHLKSSSSPKANCTNPELKLIIDVCVQLIPTFDFRIKKRWNLELFFEIFYWLSGHNERCMTSVGFSIY